MKNIILILFLLSSIACSSQKTEEIEIAKKIKLEAGTFLMKKGEISNLDSLNTKISIIEILDKKILGYNSNGVYRLFSHRSPSFTYIILKNDKNFQIVELKNFSDALKEITKYLSNFNIDSNRIVSYMEKILEIYRNNDYDKKIRL